MSLPASLSNLSIRESIQDTIYRAVTGLDVPNAALFDSAFTADATFDLNGTVMTGLAAIKKDCYDHISKLDTTHFLTNIRIQPDENDTNKAKVTASAMAQHYRTGEGMKPDTSRLLTGSLYEFDVVKDSSDDNKNDSTALWRIKLWKMKITWTEGDYGVVSQH